MSKTTRRWMYRAAASLGLALAAQAPAMAAWELNMPRGVTAISNEVYDLHMLIFGVCVAIAIVVFGAMIWSIIHHRKSKGVRAAQFSHSTRVEIVWTVIPIIILVAMAVPAAGTLVRMEDARNSDLTVKITGYQWKWHYDYIDESVSFFSSLEASANQARQLKSGIDPYEVDNYLLDVDRPLVVPVGAKVRLLLTSNDVIHSWWVPALGGKKDAIPGYINEFWFQAEEPGTYRGQCAELCGRDHAFMPVVVEVVPENQFTAWLGENATEETATAVVAAPASATPVMAANEQTGAGPAASAPAAAQPSGPWSMDGAMALGEKLYVAHCAACHQANGQGIPAAGFRPLAGSAVVTGPIPAHAQIAVHGKPGTAMAAFGPQLSDEQLAAILTYQRNAWGNETGDLVEPSDVAEVR